MQKKSINSILIIGVVLIWGVLAFKFIRPFFMDKPEVITAESLPIKTTPVTRKKDTFNLETVNRDPFLGKVFFKKQGVKKALTKKKKRKPTKKTPWPKIAYLGFVKSSTSTNKLGLVRVNKKLHRVRKNVSIENIQVFLVDKDSIGLKMNNEKKYFKR